MLPNCINVASKNNLMNKYYSILIYNTRKQNKNTSDHNNECLRDNATKIINFYRFLYHVTPVVIFQVKSWSDSNFSLFCTLATSLSSVKR